MLPIVIHGIKRNNGEYRTLSKCNFIRKEDSGVSFFSHFKRKNLKNKTIYCKKPLRLKIASFDNKIMPLYLRCNVECDLKDESSVLDVPPLSYIKRASLYND